MNGIADRGLSSTSSGIGQTDWLADALGLALAEGSPQPLATRLYHQLREWIQTGRLVCGQRLPSSRQLAGELGLGRNTVLAAFDQLLAEGFLVTRHGSGTFVADAARLLVERRIGDLPVVQGERLVGIITKDDILRAFVEVMGVGDQ